MSIDKLHLNKLLKLMYSSEKALTSELRKYIREQKAKQRGVKSSGGGNFYEPFWHDAKQHVAGMRDLSVATKERIKANRGRRHLYPLLEKGLLDIWKRGGNREVLVLEDIPKGRFQIEGLTIKVENIMPLKIDGRMRLAYPYWFREPALTQDAARIGLWLMNQALQDHSIEILRIFDVIRSEYYSVETEPLQGTEKKLFVSRYGHIVKRYKELLKEY